VAVDASTPIAIRGFGACIDGAPFCHVVVVGTLVIGNLRSG
jgi:hypothetical protein